MSDLRFSTHALERMDERGVSVADVKRLLRKGLKEPCYEGRVVYTEKPKGKRGKKNRLVQAECMVIVYAPKTNTVITVYWKVFNLSGHTTKPVVKSRKRNLDARKRTPTVDKSRSVPPHNGNGRMG